MENLISQLRETALQDKETQWFDVATPDIVLFAEQTLDLSLPVILRRCYTEISNGGFGPGYGLTGLPGGFTSSWGDLIQSTTELRKIENCEVSWLPLFDFGCAEILCVDVDDLAMVTSLEGEVHEENYDLMELLQRWCRGELPDLHSGQFR